MRLAWFAVSLIALAGCATTQPAYLANGQKVVRINCELALNRMVSCFQTAGNICGPQGFLIYDWNGDRWVKPYPDPDTIWNDQTFASNGLLVACRPRSM
jgi:hypothetical protein